MYISYSSVTRRNCVWFVSSVALSWSESEEDGKHWKNSFKRTIPTKVSSSLLNWSSPFQCLYCSCFMILLLKYLLRDDTVCGEEGKTYGNLANTFYEDNWPIYDSRLKSPVRVLLSGHNRVFLFFF